MSLPLIILSVALLTAYQVCGETNNYDYSEQRPLTTFVYTVYPFYNAETLLEVWKTDKAVDISNVVTLSPNEQGQTISFYDQLGHNETSKGSNDVQYLVNEASTANLEQLSKTRQRLSAYRNRFKTSDLQNA